MGKVTALKDEVLEYTTGNMMMPAISKRQTVKVVQSHKEGAIISS